LFKILTSKNLKIMAVFYLVAGIAMGSAAPLIPSLVIDAEISFTELGLASSVTAFLAGISLPVLGYLGDKYGKKRMLILAMGVRLAALAIFSFTLDKNLILLGYLLNELGFILYLPIARAIVSDAAGREDIGKAYGELITIVSLTEVVMPIVSGQLYNIVRDYNLMFTWIFILTLASLPILFLLDDSPRGDSIQVIKVYRLNSREKRIFLPAVLEAVSWRVWIFLLYTVPKDRLGVGPDFLGIAYTAQSSAWLLTQYISGLLTDRLGAKKIYILSDSIMIPMTILYIFYLNQLTVIVNAALFGLSISLWIPAFTKIVYEASDEETRALTYSKVESLRQLASTPAGQVGGFLYDSVSYAAPFALGLGMIVSTIILEYKLFPDV